MRGMIVTTPIRPIPTPFPPIGSLSILKYLRKNGIDDVEFFNIDAKRPSYDEALEHICAMQPDVLGISSVVSTAYAYTKCLSLDVKRLLPETLIVCGGSLAASAEILLRRTGIDLCATGEGERTFLKIIKHRATTNDPVDFRHIPGLVLIDRNDRLINTGYEEQLSPEEVYDFDWADLEKAADIGLFVLPAIENGLPSDSFREDPRAYEAKRANKKQIVMPGAKGCVAKCTFCHRFTKGIRYIPVDLIIERIKDVVARYDVGFIDMADENFGTDKRWLREFCEKIKPLDVLWRVGGMRVNCVSQDIIAMMKDAGCCSIIYGMETGSEKIIKVMEKKVAIQDNFNAMEWTIGAGLRSVVQLVIGMPGETPETIEETAKFAKFANSLSPDQCPTDLSINYAQALPGTPLYEFGRSIGVIDRDLGSEEAYLLKISDTNAHDEFNTLNFTSYPTLVCQTWRIRIQIAAFIEYQRKFGRAHYREMLVRFSGYFERAKSDSGYFANPKRLVDRSETTEGIHQTRTTLTLDASVEYPSLIKLLAKGQIGLAVICYPEWFARAKWALLPLMLLRSLRYQGVVATQGLITEYLAWLLGKKASAGTYVEAKSLRKIVADAKTQLQDTPAMEVLRRGR